MCLDALQNDLVQLLVPYRSLTGLGTLGLPVVRLSVCLSVCPSVCLSVRPQNFVPSLLKTWKDIHHSNFAQMFVNTCKYCPSFLFLSTFNVKVTLRGQRSYFWLSEFFLPSWRLKKTYIVQTFHKCSLAHADNARHFPLSLQCQGHTYRSKVIF